MSERGRPATTWALVATTSCPVGWCRTITPDPVSSTVPRLSLVRRQRILTTLGISRDDAENGFLTEYLRTKVLKDNPFASIDQEGVGQLVAGAVEKGRKTNPELSVGVCGEHGGDPDSIHFFNKTGLDYVSCSPFRVPIARFAAAQAVISQQEK